MHILVLLRFWNKKDSGLHPLQEHHKNKNVENERFSDSKYYEQIKLIKEKLNNLMPSKKIDDDIGIFNLSNRGRRGHPESFKNDHGLKMLQAFIINPDNATQAPPEMRLSNLSRKPPFSRRRLLKFLTLYLLL